MDKAADVRPLTAEQRIALMLGTALMQAAGAQDQVVAQAATIADLQETIARLTRAAAESAADGEQQ